MEDESLGFPWPHRHSQRGFGTRRFRAKEVGLGCTEEVGTTHTPPSASGSKAFIRSRADQRLVPQLPWELGALLVSNQAGETTSLT